jgi:tRNA(Ile2) C34 agmatinyltransferase TiaS
MPSLGILWDGMLNPICPVCDLALGAYGTDVGFGPGCQCPKCNHVFRFADEEGRAMNLKRAKAIAAQNLSPSAS